ncbi:hypothetical protein [Actinocorallia herbida]|uniref:hypothetical protein n=1 Tax=Actinocorallia herbida TaxID=58109 RepID=UPI000F4C8C90|nr:hypothetical protein [Actinocorallia herbida]
MKREELDDLLILISRLGGEILVVGSQAILAAVPEERLPAEATASVEVDVAFLDGDEESRTSLTVRSVSTRATTRNTMSTLKALG